MLKARFALLLFLAMRICASGENDYDCVFPSALNVFDESGVIDVSGCNTRVYQSHSSRASWFNPSLSVSEKNLRDSCPTDVQCDGQACVAANRYASRLDLPIWPAMPAAGRTQTIQNANDNVNPSKNRLTISTNGQFDVVIDNERVNSFYDLKLQNGSDVTLRYSGSYDTKPFMIKNLYLHSGGGHGITLEPGDYYVENFYFQAGTNLYVSGVGDGSGTARLYVKNGISIFATSTFFNYDTALPAMEQHSEKLLIASYSGDIALASGVRIAGHLYADTGDITVNAGDTHFTGSATAENIWFQDGAKVSYPIYKLGDGLCSTGIDSAEVSSNRMDAVDPDITGSDYNEGGTHHYVAAKVANRGGYQATAVLLDSNNSEAFNYSARPFDIPLTVLFSLSRDHTGCEEADVDLIDEDGSGAVFAQIEHGSATGRSNTYRIPETFADKQAYLKIRYIDINALLLENAVTCQVSNLDANMKGLPQCIANSAGSSDSTCSSGGDSSSATNKYIKTFGCEAYNRCVVQSNACDSNAYSSGGRLPDAPYDSPYGCYECTVGATCSFSKDPFSARPDRFEILHSATQDFPNLLRSGEDYNLSITAFADGSSEIVTDYNQSLYDTGGLLNLHAGATVLLKNGERATAEDDLHGTVRWGNGTFKIAEGLSAKEGTTGSEVAGIRFDDVGRVEIEIADKTWGAVDFQNSNDPTSEDCNETGGFICGMKNVTYIPYAFRLDDMKLNNAFGTASAFTYLANMDMNESDSMQMSGSVSMKIAAVNKQNEVVLNFKTGEQYYENPVSATLDVRSDIYGEGNTSAIHTALLGFGSDGMNGVYSVEANETSLTKALRFNYPRGVNEAVNPFEITSEDITVKVLSQYNDTFGSADIVQRNDYNISGATRFYYGRTHAPRYRIAENEGEVQVYYEVFCSPKADKFGQTCDPGMHPDVMAGNILSPDDIYWYRNMEHNASFGRLLDSGGISERETIYGNSIEETYVSSNGPIEVWKLTYDEGRGYPFKTSIKLLSSPWLIYHRFDPQKSSNEFSLEFSSKGAWAGKEVNNQSVDSQAAIRTNRRIEW
jgi:hypothetical protein